MVKCGICKGKVEKTFLDKIKGTYIKGKTICSDCQRKFKKEELLEKL